MKTRFKISVGATLIAVTMFALYCGSGGGGNNNPAGGDDNTPTPTQYTLETNANPIVGGIVLPAGRTPHDSGTLVALDAEAAIGYVFVNWVGAGITDVNSPSTTILMNANRTVIANFALDEPAPPACSPWQDDGCPTDEGYCGNGCALVERSTCSDSFGQTRPESCDVLQCSAGVDCDDDFGRCTVGTTCTNNATRSSCRNQNGTFAYNTSCPLITFYCPAACAEQTGANRPNSCFETKTACEASVAPPQCTEGVDCNTDRGRCMIGTTCVDDVTRSVCSNQSGIFLFNTSCSVVVPTYTVTVSSAGAGASGGGSYEQGARVSIYAGTAPAGYRFINWTTTSAGVTLANANSSTTTFTMPANEVTVTANFEFITTFVATVSSAGTGASGSGSYAQNATVQISAGIVAGQNFVNWTTTSEGVTFNNANMPSTTFRMPAHAVTVTANFEPRETGEFTDVRDGKTYRFVKIGRQVWMAENLNFETEEGSFCYGDGYVPLGQDQFGRFQYARLSPEEVQANCIKYGRLYDWLTVLAGGPSSTSNPSRVQGICPVGWHLPSLAEWTELANFAGGAATERPGGEPAAGTRLMSTTGWDPGPSPLVGTDDFGFSALPGGMSSGLPFTVDGEEDLVFDRIGYSTSWWSTTTASGTARARHFSIYYTTRFTDPTLVTSILGDLEQRHLHSVRCVRD